MNIKYTISLNLLIILSSIPCWSAASNPETKTNIGLLAQLYEEGADMTQKILAFTSLNNQDIAQLAFIGRRLPWRFPKLYVDAMEELLKRRVEPILRRNNGNAQEAFFAAAQSNYPWAIEYLVRHGADVNARDIIYGRTPLMVAARYGHADVVAQLLQRGADVNAKDNRSVTALMLAAEKGYAEVVILLLAAGADVNAKKDNDGMTPLMWAAAYGHVDVVAQLLQRGANVNAKDNDGETPLMREARLGRVDVAAKLISAGADVNARDIYGRTPLMTAARYGYADIAKLLIINGATYSDLPELLRRRVDKWLGE